MKKMKFKNIFIFSFFILHSFVLHSQTGVIKGRVFNEKNNEPLEFANIIIEGTTIGSTTDLDGRFIFTGLKPGYAKLIVSTLGFERFITGEIMITNAKPANIDIAMKEMTFTLKNVEIKSKPFQKSSESPVSVRTLGMSELERSPGGNRDVSRVIQALPGVSSGASFRNDVIVRGGGASENRFFLDDIEIPNINHFATQGASGGPVGIINIDFVREIDFYSSAFPASRGNALSSVLNIKQVEGNKDKLRFKGAVGASDLSLAIDGPLNKKTTYLLSVRRSYLQFLFNTLGLPFLPTYNDYQLKVTHKIDQKNQINIISLGALDLFKLNTGIKSPDESQKYILGYLPVNEQWNYTFGIVYKHFAKNGYRNIILSRNYLNNSQYKYKNNDESSVGNKILDYSSSEIENKFRFENVYNKNGFRVNMGFGGEYDKYFNSTFQKLFIGNIQQIIDYNSSLEMIKWNVFLQTNKSFFNDKLTLSAGLRSDANNYSTSMSNMLQQISPRFSLSYNFVPKWNFNFSTAQYYQLPAYTTLGYRNNQGVLINKSNNLKYISAYHLVAGFEYFPKDNIKISAEGFFKYYQNYPFSIKDSIPLASKGTDFGVVGDEEVLSISKGRAYGFELFANRKLSKKLDFTFAYTFVRSEFQNLKNTYIPSAWDNKHLFTAILSKSFNKNWNIGLKWRYVDGSPYTPIDEINSSYKLAWDNRGRGIIDYSRFNELRLGAFHQLDIRVDKAFYFKKLTLTIYTDIQNIYNFKAESSPTVVLDIDANGSPVIINPTETINLQRYKLKYLNSNGGGTILPTIGIIVEL